MTPLKVSLSSSTRASIRLRTSFHVVAPTSLASQLATRLLGLLLGLACVVTPFADLEVRYGLRVTKNFNPYTNAAIDTEAFDNAPILRRGSEAGLETFLVATGAEATEWGIGNSVALAWRFAERWALSVGFDFMVAISYLDNTPVDAYASPYAQPNRGVSELMRGDLQLSFQPFPYLGIALGTATEQAPLGPDNTAVRSPWWDGGNGASNRQVFYLDIVGSM